MSYQVLARKWRPRGFESLVGQEHVVKALSHALDQQRLHHAYLFTGTRGVGKTTLARILAKALNCEAGVSARPCGVCGACREIDSGRFVDLLEVDAATNTRVEEMRQLLESATYAPTRGRFKIYVIDEVHMLSNSAFNAMLKTLEEPPEHMKFILATTDPQKIPVTVLSRCLQFNLKQMPPPAIAAHLARVLEAEAVPFDAPALPLIAKAAAGSMRDALSLLDQAIAHGAGRIDVAGVRDMLGTVGDDYIFDILDALVAGSVSDMVSVADTMASRSLSFDSAAELLARVLHRIALCQIAPDAVTDEAERVRMQGYAQALDAEFVQLCYQIAVQGRADLPLAPDDHAGFSMMLLRLGAFRPLVPTPQAIDLPGAVSAGLAGSGATRDRSATAMHAKVRDPEPRRAEIVPLAPAYGVGAPTTGDTSGGQGDTAWQGLIRQLRLGGMPRELAQHCEWLGHAAGVLRLRLSPAHRSLLVKPAQDKLQAVLEAHFGAPLRLSIEIGETRSATPVEQRRAEQREKLERAIAAIEQDHFVRETIEQFDATISESSIRPLH